MKQIIQDLKTGATLLEEVPVPAALPGQVLIRTRRSLVSTGTEKMLVEFGKAGLLGKALQQPERVRQVMDKIKTDGLKPALTAVTRKLDTPLPLGYCNAGVVVAVGEGVRGFRPGDRVASNGPHAEFVCVPQNLVAKIPDEVDDDEAAFAVAGAIALQGIRLMELSFGETVAVIGLGLIGMLGVQLLQAHGCRVIGLDTDEEKVLLVRSWGIEAETVSEWNDPVAFVKSRQAPGADAVLITASTASHSVVSQAADMSRKRGRIVLTGVVGLNLKRSDFYEKELRFQVSSSYGPGRYDPEYEQKGVDYPYPFVRWTAQRNFEAVLTATAAGRLRLKPLVTESVELSDYRRIYDRLHRGGVYLLRYPQEEGPLKPVIALKERAFNGQKGVLGIIGAGNFTSAVVLPELKKLRADIKYIASAKGLSAATLARKYGIAFAAADYRPILEDPEVDAVFIFTRHGEHAALTVEALEKGKHVLVEKPLALTLAELERIEIAHAASGKILHVGFNRRFSPFARELKKRIAGNPALQLSATVNAGRIPADHWTLDPRQGGGRVVGEVCHFIDLLSYLADAPVEAVAAASIDDSLSENVSVLLRFKNGARGVIQYFSGGAKSYPKERIEAHCAGNTFVIDNFRKLECYGQSGGRRGSQDKGHGAQFALLMDGLRRGGPALIPFESLLNTSKTAILIETAIKNNCWIDV